MIVTGRELARRLEWAEGANDSECTPASPSTAVERIAGGYAVFAGPASPLSRVIGLGLAAPAGEAELEAVENFFHTRGGKASIDLCPLADPALLDALGRRGYRAIEFNNAMARQLSGSNPYPDEPNVRLARESEQDLWSSTVGRAFFESAHLTGEEMEVGHAVFRIGASECCLIFAESGEPVAGAALAIRDGLALLFADGTVPGFRNKGLHAASIRFRLNLAMARGCDLATATTVPGSVSQRNFERLGFRVVYTKVLFVEP